MSEINKNTLVDKTDLLQFASKYYGVSPERVRMELKQRTYSRADNSSDKEPLFFVVSFSMYRPMFGEPFFLSLDGAGVGFGQWFTGLAYCWFDSFSSTRDMMFDEFLLLVGYEFTIV